LIRINGSGGAHGRTNPTSVQSAHRRERRRAGRSVAQAAAENIVSGPGGRKRKDLVEQGLRLVLETPRQPTKNRSLVGLTKQACVGSSTPVWSTSDLTPSISKALAVVPAAVVDMERS